MRSRPIRAERGEQGQVALALVLITIIALITVAFVGVLGISLAADERSQAQTAADAAALAGVEAVPGALTILFDAIDAKDDLGTLVLGCNLGRAQAQTYANQNGASLTSYCFNASTGRAEVVVRMNEPVSDEAGYAEAGATASNGFARSSCSWLDDEPEETEAPEPAPPVEGETPPPPPPAPDWTTTLTCGALKVVYTVNGETGALTLTSVDVASLEPKLVG